MRGIQLGCGFDIWKIPIDITKQMERQKKDVSERVKIETKIILRSPRHPGGEKSLNDTIAMFASRTYLAEETVKFGYFKY